MVEGHRRSLSQAQQSAAVTDAGRILDFSHAAESISASGEAVRVAGYCSPHPWVNGVLHRLTHEGPERALPHLARLYQRCPSPESKTGVPSLLRRHDQMQD